MINKHTYSELSSSGVYRIKNITTGDFYIGSAKCFRTRINAHRSKIRRGKHHNKHLQSAISKYGEDSFSFEIVEFCEKEELYKRELHYLDTLRPEYNKQLRAGAWRGSATKNKGGFQKGYKQSEETKERRKLTFDLKKAEGWVRNRPPHSEETKQRMILAKKKRKLAL